MDQKKVSRNLQGDFRMSEKMNENSLKEIQRILESLLVEVPEGLDRKSYYEGLRDGILRERKRILNLILMKK